MEFEGNVLKDGKMWIIEIPSLNVMTQGKTKKEAFEMIKDAVIGLIECYFESKVKQDFTVNVTDYGKGVFGMTSSDSKLLLAFSLIRQRELSGSTVREASERLGSKSPNAYAQYERGKTNISLDKYESLLLAANPYQVRRLRVI